MFKAPISWSLRKFAKAVSLGLVIAALSSSPALADWRSDMGVLRVGISSIEGEALRAGTFDEFRKLLADTLNMPVEIFQANDASTLIDAMASSRIEYAILPAAGYATLDIFCSCVLPIAAPIAENGSDAVRSVFITDQNRIANLADVSGRRIAVGPPASLSGFMLPYAFFQASGKSLENSGAIIVETTSQTEAVKLFHDGEVDGFFAWESATLGSEKSYKNEFLNTADENSELRPVILWRSEPVRYGPHVVRNNLPKEAVDALSSALLSMNEKAPLAYDAVSPELAGGMQTVVRDDYNVVSTMVRALAEK